MKAICRVAKIKGSGSIGGKSDHNYRLGHVPNADPDRQHLNHEYVLNYETLAKAIQARIEGAGIERVRQDAVKGIEFILTASPETFKRDQTGQVVGDYRTSAWVTANLQFMQQTYGRNLVAFTLHQDEKTPHIHAIVVPVTKDNRLCAKELFTPKTLRQLQTDYAAAMKPFGLERGIEGSRAQHVSMKHIYGLQQQERQQIEQQLSPIQQEKTPLYIESPGVLDLLNLEKWKQQQEALLNAEYERRVSEIQKAAVVAQNAAVANVQAREQAKVLQQRLNTSEGLKQANYQRVQEVSQKLAYSNQLVERVAVLVDEKRLNPQWSQQTAQQVRERVLPQLEKDLLKSVQTITSRDGVQAGQQVKESLEKQGYKFARNVEGKTSLLVEPISQVRIDLATDKVQGQTLRQLVSQRVEELQKQDQRQSQRRSRGLGL